MLTRRRFLGTSAAAGMALATPGCSLGSAREPKGSVAVVGAGLAGLTAADRLEALGFEVTVLEARSRAGGRVYTWRLPGGQHAEAGGEFIDADHRAMRALVRRFGLALEDSENAPGGMDVAYLDGVRESYASAVTPSVDAEADRFYSRIARAAERIDPSDPAAAGAALDRRSAGDLLDELRLSADARLFVEFGLRQEYTAEAGELSLLFVVQGEAVGEDIPESGRERFRIRGGNSRLVRALAGGLRDVRTGAAVDSVSVRGDRVEVNAGSERVRADWCVLAAPMRTLAGIEFSPGLPRLWAEAADRLVYGQGSKTALACRTRPWRREGLTGNAATDLGVGETWDATDGQRGGRGALMAWAVSEPARALTAMPPPQRIRAALAEADAVFPGVSAGFDTGRTSDWSASPFSRGTYAAWAPGQVTRYWRALRRREGRLLLAGEHTDEWSGYMEGAVRSGKRAAEQIRKSA